MTNIPFFKAVTYTSKNCTQNMLEKIDDFFFIKGKKVNVIPGFKQGKSEGVREKAYEKTTAAQTALKIALYCTAIIPLIVLLVKVALRLIHRFHFIPTSSSPIGSISPVKNGNDDYPHLEFDVPTTLSCDQVVKLEIKETMALLENGATVPYKGYSSLNEYQNSWFECIYINSNTYVITRRHLAEDFEVGVKYLPFNVPTKLSLKEIVKFKLTNTRDRYMAFSELPIYEDSFFMCTLDKDLYTITRKALKNLYNPDYPWLPLNKEVRVIGVEKFRELKLENMQLSKTDGYVHGNSILPEYKDYKMKWKEELYKGQPSVLITRY